jgi:PAS domain S-box-containing protein
MVLLPCQELEMRDADKTREQLIEELARMRVSVAEPKQAEERLIRSENKYHFLMENAGEAILIVQDGMLKFANRRTVELFDCPEETIISKPFVTFIHPEDRDMVFHRYSQRLKGEELSDVCPFRVLRKDGTVKWVEVHAVLVLWEGAPATLSFLHDISELKQAEDALRRSEERLRLTLEAINDGVWDWNVVTGAAIFSPRWYTMLDYEPHEFPSTYASWKSLIHPDDIDWVEREIKQHLASGKGYSMEIRMRTKAGAWRWILTRGKVVDRDAAGCPVRMVGTHSDITERKQGEEERRELEAQLQQNQKIEALGTLAGGIAHDFNNIIGIIMSSAEVAGLSLSQDCKARRRIEEILEATQRARELVRQILTFSYRQERERKPLQLAPTLNDVLKLLRTAMPATVEVRREIQMADNDALILGDPTQIHQLLMNLVTNAVHAMEGKAGVLRIALEPVHFTAVDSGKPLELGPGEYLKLTVADTGHGIDQEIMDRIFNPYYTTKGPGEGTGLGLSVVHGIVKDYQGVVTVESRPGVGTAFHVYLPRLKGA